MGKTVQNPKKHIISCRVSDEEMNVLQHVAERNGCNISDLLRETLSLLQQRNSRAA